MSSKSSFTELDSQLRELALTNWPKFVKLVGPVAINKAKICLMKKDNRTVRYMAYRAKMSKSTAADTCKRCPD